MAPRQITWSRLVPGLLASAAIVGIVLAILLYGGIGALHGKTVRLYVATSQARGVTTGTDVWLEGQRVGKVRKVRFQSIDVDTAKRLLIEMDILASHLEHLRRDSRAQIRSGGTLIGQPVIYVTVGTPDAAPLAKRDTLASLPQGDFEGISSQIALTSRHFPAIIQNVKTMNAQLKGARGTLGAFGLDENRRELDVLRARAGDLAERATESDGSIARSLRHGRLMERAGTAMAQADSIRTLLSGAGKRFGRFRRDSTLLRTITDIRNEVSIVRARLANAEGTAGRAVGDRAVLQQLALLEKELGLVMQDVKQNPMRYVHFE